MEQSREILDVNDIRKTVFHQLSKVETQKEILGGRERMIVERNIGRERSQQAQKQTKGERRKMTKGFGRQSTTGQRQRQRVTQRKTKDKRERESV